MKEKSPFPGVSIKEKSLKMHFSSLDTDEGNHTLYFHAIRILLKDLSGVRPVEREYDRLFEKMTLLHRRDITEKNFDNHST